MDVFKAMTTFVAVVEHEGFAAAGRSLGQSKAQVSRVISGLEDHLGVRLLQRSTRKHALTEEGDRYLRHARDALEENAKVEGELGEARVVPRGRLRLNAPFSYGERFLGPLLPEFQLLYPEINLDITLTDRFVDLVDEGYDVAIRIGGDPTSNLIAKKLGTIDHGLYASPTYLKDAPKLVSTIDLKKHRCLGYAISGEVRPWYFQGERVTVVPTMISNNGDILRSAAAAGLGLTMLPTFIVADDVEKGVLVNLLGDCPPDAKDLTFPLLAVYPARRHLSPKVRVFVDFLAEQLARDGKNP